MENKTCFTCVYSHIFNEELLCGKNSNCNDGSDYIKVSEDDNKNCWSENKQSIIYFKRELLCVENFELNNGQINELYKESLKLLDNDKVELTLDDIKNFIGLEYNIHKNDKDFGLDTIRKDMLEVINMYNQRC